MSNPLPRITVITPSLNQAEFLERTICSVLDQGYENLEYFVMDGGSVDGSVDLILAYADRISYWQSEQDAGPADAINQALEHATGEIIAVINADDLYLPFTLHEVAKRMSKEDASQAPAWVVGHCLRIGEMDEQLGQVNARRPSDLAGFLMHDTGHLPVAATFYRSSVFEAYGRFDPKLQFAWQYEMECRLIAEGLSPTIIPAVLSAHREYAHSKSAQNILRCGPEYADAASRYSDRLPFEHRSALCTDIEERDRIFELAKMDMAMNPSRRHLWNQLLRRPWWLANSRYRQTLLRGVTHPEQAVPSSAEAAMRHAA